MKLLTLLIITICASPLLLAGRYDCLPLSQDGFSLDKISDLLESPQKGCQITADNALFGSDAFSPPALAFAENQKEIADLDELQSFNNRAFTLWNQLLAVTGQDAHQARLLYFDASRLPDAIKENIQQLQHDIFFFANSSQVTRSDTETKLDIALHPLLSQMLVNEIIHNHLDPEKMDSLTEGDQMNILRLVFITNQGGCFNWGLQPLATILILRNTPLYTSLYRGVWTKIMLECPLDIIVFSSDSILINYSVNLKNDKEHEPMYRFMPKTFSAILGSSPYESAIKSLKNLYLKKITPYMP